MLFHKIDLDKCDQSLATDSVKLVTKLVGLANSNSDTFELILDLPLRQLLERAFSPFDLDEDKNSTSIIFGS